mmetsp:Transcript_80875/g.142565  ORF Transcript_80875/g.142565 Transcript_80875/m.142565 type:complete len:210 (-) Transcript_80875:715-1344(-)
MSESRSRSPDRNGKNDRALVRARSRSKSRSVDRARDRDRHRDRSRSPPRRRARYSESPPPRRRGGSPMGRVAQLCRDYLRGHCRFGHSCKFSHNRPTSKIELCRDWERGKCAFGDTCKYRHGDAEDDASARERAQASLSPSSNPPSTSLSTPGLMLGPTPTAFSPLLPPTFPSSMCVVWSRSTHFSSHLCLPIFDTGSVLTRLPISECT